MLTVGSLFSGIGGLDLGLERAGMTIRWQAEVDPYASRVLAKHWPDVPNLGDVTKVDWENDGLDHGDGIVRSLHVDLVCGGFPCQPFSVAGKRLGKDDDRYLWPEFARCLRELRPRYALLENVPGLLVRGMGDVLADLAALGFDAEWDCVSAAHVGAPHLRYRVFIVAYADSRRRRREHFGMSTESIFHAPAHGRGAQTVAYADSERLEERWLPAKGRQCVSDIAGSGGRGEGADTLAYADGTGCSQQRRPSATRTQQPASERPSWWDVEPDVGRVANGIPSRVDRLRCLGNAVVPQVAEWVGRRIMNAQADRQST